MSQINVNNIVGKNGASAVTFPHGINVTGVVTATQLNQNVTGNVTASSFTGPLTGNVTGTASLASNLTGTPNITVGTVTGTDATFSGNLTVNGTTTTIDTAVTAVDSLAVDGNVGVGTTNPVTKLVVASSDSGHADMRFQNSTTGYATNNGFWVGINNNENALIYNYHDSDLMFATNSTERLRIDRHGTTKFSGPLTEKCNRDGGAGLSGNYVHHLKTYGNVHWATNNSSGTWTYDITGDGSTDLNDMMTDQETLSFQLISSQNNASYYMTELRIDGSNAHTVWWQGGSAPSAGGASGYDVYTFTIFKRLNASFRIFASLTNHA